MRWDYSDVPELFHARFRKLVDDSDKSREQIAEALGVTKQALSYWYLGRNTVNIKTLCKIADLFQVSTDWLLGRSEGPYGQ